MPEEVKIKIVGCQKTRELSLPYAEDSLETISMKALPEHGGYSAYFQNKIIPRENWKDTFPALDSQIVFVPDFGDPGSLALALMNIMGFAATAAPAVGFTATYLTYAAITLAITAGMAIGAGYLVQALTPKPKQYDADGPSTAYSWDPHTTAQQGMVRPRIYGKFKSYGNIIGSYITVDPSDKTRLKLHALVCYGEGVAKELTDIRINDQPTSNFKNMSVETRRGLLNQTPISFFDKLRKSHHPNVTISNAGGAFTYEISGDDHNDLDVILRFNCWYFHKSGKQGAMGCGVKIEIRELPAGEFQTAYDGSVSNAGANTDVFWTSFKMSDYVTVTRGVKHEIRVSKTSGDVDEARAKNEMALDFVTEISNDALQYPYLILVGVSGILTEEFTGLQDVSVVIEGQIVQQWDDEEEEWINDWSDNPGWVALDILTQPVFSGDGSVEDPYVVEEYEGMSPERVNLDAIGELTEHCNTQCPDGKGGEESLITFNGQFDQALSVWEDLLQVCQMARCVPVWEGNKVSVVIDQPSERVGVLAAGNILQGTFEEDFLPKIDRVSEIELAYNDIATGYKRGILPVFSPTLKTHANKITFDFPGIVKKTEAWRLARFHLAHNELLKRKIKVQSDIDCLSYKLGSRLGVSCDIANWGVLKEKSRGSGRIAAYIPGDTTDQIKLDYNISEAVEEGPTYEILVRLRDDTQVFRVIQSIDEDTITVNKFTGEVLPQADDLWIAGKQTLVVKDFRLLNRTRSPELEYDLDLIEYDIGLYTGDQSTPLVPSLYITPAHSDRRIVKPLKLSDLRSRNPEVSIDIGSYDIPWTTNLLWNSNAPEAGYVSWVAKDDADPILITYGGESYQIEPGNTNKEYVYWDDDFPTTFRTTDDIADVIGGGNWLVCYNTSGAAYPVILNSLVHGKLVEVETIDTSQLVNLAVTTAKLDALAVTLAKLAANAVDSTKIVDNAVTTDKLNALAVTLAKLAANAVDSTKIVNNAVTTDKLNTLAVTTAKIAADAVTAAEIATGAVGSTELAAGSVIAGKIAAGTIVANDIAAGTITGAKIAATTITASNIAALTITAAQIAALTITAAKIAAGTITTNEIAALTIAAGNIAANAITAAKIAADAVETDKIKANAVTAAKIAAGTITTNEIAALTIAAGNIAANAITAAKINALAVETEKIAALAVTADKIAANAITAAKIAAGTITANEMAANSIATAALQAQCVTAAIIQAGCITATHLSTGELITLSAQIKDAIISSAKIGLLEVKTANIENLNVTTGKLDDNAVSNEASAFTADYEQVKYPTWEVVQSVSITIVGGSVQICAAIYVGGYDAKVRITRDSTIIRDYSNINIDAGLWWSRIIIDSPGAGSYTYKIEVTSFSSSYTSAIWNRELSVRELKK